MGTVILDMAISLDGYIDGTSIYDWYFAPAPPSKAVIDELVNGLGAIIMGRKTFEQGDEGDGFADDPYTAARFVLTHHPPPTPMTRTKSFTFVTDGIESALRQAQAAAGGRDVAIGGGAEVARQYLNAGLIDEIQLHIVPRLAGSGLRLFDGNSPQQLVVTRVIDSVGVTHVKYRVMK